MGVGLNRFADDLTFKASILFLIADDFAVERDNPPSFAFPFRWQQRGMKRACIAEIERSGSGVNNTWRGGLDLFTAIRRLARAIRAPERELRSKFRKFGKPLARGSRPFASAPLDDGKPILF